MSLEVFQIHTVIKTPLYPRVSNNAVFQMQLSLRSCSLEALPRSYCECQH